MEEIIFTINGQQVKGKAGSTIVDVAQQYGIPIPTLCHDPCLIPLGACRVCLVEDEKRGTLVASCVTPIAAAMSIRTDSHKVLEARRVIVKLMIASHPESCILCEKGNRCKLRQIAADLGIGLVDYYPMPNFTGTQELNPFIRRDLSKCILCAKCIRADHELVVEGAIDYTDRGFNAHPATLADGPLEISECTFCGTCVEMCPTGALFERDKPLRGTATKRVPTTCSLCGCGCSFWLGVSYNRVTGVQPGIAGSFNGSTLCVKGHYGYDLINHPERLQKPLLRKEGTLVEVSWDEALQAAAQGITNIKKKNGKGSLALLTGPHCTNEEAYVLKHFATHVLDTEHVLCNTGMNLSNLIQGMDETLGFVGMHTSMKDIEDAGTIVLIGANPTESAPVLGYGIKRAVRNKKATLVVIDPLEIKLTKHAALWLRPSLNTDEILLGAFLRLLLENDHVKKRGKDVNALRKQLKDVSLDDLQATTGVSGDMLAQAVEAFCSASKRALVFGNGIIGQPRGKNLVKLICTLSALSGTGTSVFPVLKQSNTLGCVHMGLANGETPETLAAAITKGAVKGLWIIGDDPVTTLPGGSITEKALEALELLIVSDPFLSTTGTKAHIVLPSATCAEKSGTITSMDGRVQAIRPAIACIGESRPDWKIILQLAEQLGAPLACAEAEDITKEIAKRIPLYAGLDLPALCTRDYSCYTLPAASAHKKNPLFIPKDIPAGAAPDNDYPYALMVGSMVSQLGCGHQTKFSLKLSKLVADEYAEINPADASRHRIQEHEAIRLISHAGEKTVQAHITDKVPAGVLFLPLPFARGSALLPAVQHGTSGKICSIRIERATI